MRKEMYCLFVLVLLLLATTTLYAGEEPWMQGRDPQKFGGTLTLARGWEPLSLDSLLTTYGEQAHLYLSEPPFTFGPGGEFVPAGWVEEVTQSDDELIITFTLKEGVTFHDGHPLNAEAFAWLLRRRIEDPAIYSDPLMYVPDTDHIQVVDEYTLKIVQVGQPWPELFYNMSTPSWLGAMRTPNAIERYGEEYGYRIAYGNGPFLLKEWIKGDHLTFERNPDYWWSPSWASEYAGLAEGEEYHPGPPYLEELVLKYIPESSTRVAMLRTREVDGIVEVPTLHIEEIKRIPGVVILEAPSYAIRIIEYNTTTGPLEELKVRQALNYAINREAMIQVIYQGYAEPAYSLYCGLPLETEDTLHLYHFNPDKAATLLDEAGWVLGEDGFRYKEGQRLSFELWSSDKTEYRMHGEMAQGMWQAVGVDARMRTFDEATLRSRIEAGEHEAVVFEHQWVTKGDMYNWWFNPEYSWYPQKTGLDTPGLRELIDATFAAQTEEELDKSVDELVNYYYEQAAMAGLVRPSSLLAIYDDVMNIYPTGEGWWGWMPRLYDTYLLEVYEANP